MIARMHDPQRFLELLNTYARGHISPEERSELFSYILAGEHEGLLSDHVQHQLENADIVAVEVDLPPQRAQEIVRRILTAEGQTSHILPRIPGRGRLTAWVAAASILLFLALAGWLLLLPRDPAQKMKLAVTAAGLTQKSYTRNNTTDQPMKFQLEDGSIITLQPGSQLDYPAHFLKDRREVVLDGEAFFEVSRSPQRPFYVYDGDLVTHVLGTSFNVKINRQKSQIEVAVRTGKVEVYERSASGTENKNDKFSNGVILTPNQKVVYTMDNRQFASSIVEIPLPIIRDTVRKDDGDQGAALFVFEAAPLSQILQSLKTAYGIDIEVENDNINNCLFTGDISNQNLYEKLDILCQALKASYEVKGTRILIRGNGCN